MFKKKKIIDSSTNIPKQLPNFHIEEKIVCINGKNVLFPVKVFDAVDCEELITQSSIEILDIDNIKIATEE